MERLDKFLSNNKVGSRSDVKNYIKKGAVKVNGEVIKNPAFKVNIEKDEIYFDGNRIEDKKYIYLMMNKPEGVVSATEDNYDRTVIDLLSVDDSLYEPFPVGRLDKDTVGLLLITNDGELNHRLISPKWKVDKKYFAKLRDDAEDKLVEKFKKGIFIDEGYRCKEAKLEINVENRKEIYLTIQEGKFHQVKKMFEAVDNKVTYLKRVEFGSLTLDETLSEGNYRHLTEEEVRRLFSSAKLEK